MAEQEYGIGEGPATRVSLSLPLGTLQAIRSQVDDRQFSSFVASVLADELRGRVIDEYLADCVRRTGPISDEDRRWAQGALEQALGLEVLRSEAED
ncbi:hypothetical protein [Nocardia stercoris]|uniref:CopG family transcriptional regulator n=1 Tax=Nocardia stercoris TaxID=2483361 RepID=A0A3M2LE58_9NOCA|nr:hypothetical protein [Nocardia stercoris]RMI34883.1 hypothetical protein EBN03_00475 [Nocardia stercoris]